MKLFRLLSWLFLYAVPIIIVFVFFYQRQEFRVTFGVSGIILLSVLFIKLYGRFKKWLLIKEQAHENARNLGMQSHTTNFILIEVFNFLFLAFPFAILLWVIYIMKHYDGRMNLPILFILVSFTASGVFKILFRTKEQADIAAEQLTTQDNQIEAIAQRVKAIL